jgi:hypothetical protein
MADINIVRRGGGIGLSFKVVGGTSAPSSPKENTIWVNTSTTITGWTFQHAGVVAYEGRVWIDVGTSSTATFNASKKNVLMIYPVAVKQYINGAWVSKTAKIYKNGSWVEIAASAFYIFKSGTGLMNGITGFSNATCSTTAITGTSPIYSSNKEYKYIECNESIDVTNYSTAHFSGVSCAFDGNGNANNSKVSVYVGSASTVVGSTVTSGTATLASDGTYTVDISSIKGFAKFGASFYSTASYAVSFKNFSIGNIWFD